MGGWGGGGGELFRSLWWVGLRLLEHRNYSSAKIQQFPKSYPKPYKPKMALSPEPLTLYGANLGPASGVP